MLCFAYSALLSDMSLMILRCRKELCAFYLTDYSFFFLHFCKEIKHRSRFSIVNLNTFNDPTEHILILFVFVLV